jgi:hypothetical protein
MVYIPDNTDILPKYYQTSKNATMSRNGGKFHSYFEYKYFKIRLLCFYITRRFNIGILFQILEYIIESIYFFLT